MARGPIGRRGETKGSGRVTARMSAAEPPRGVNSAPLAQRAWGNIPAAQAPFSSSRRSCANTSAPCPFDHEEAQAALRIEDVAARRMVHRVAARRGARHLLVDHLEFLRRRARSRRRRRTGRGSAGRTPARIARAARGVSRSGSTVTNSTCTRSASGPSCFIASASVGQRRRAHVGALRVAEEHARPPCRGNRRACACLPLWSVSAKSRPNAAPVTSDALNGGPPLPQPASRASASSSDGRERRTRSARRALSESHAMRQ